MKISDAEWKVMNLLWERAPLTITQMAHTFAEEGWSKSMVITYLNRLEKKGAVWYRQGPKARYYYPGIDQRETNTEAARGFLDKVFHGDIALMVSTMVQREALSEEDLDELRQIPEKEKHTE